MNNNMVTRASFESMVSADLVALAEKYSIDVPENLNRRFLIAELLEAVTEMEDAEADDITLVEEVLVQPELPMSNNETEINAVLRNPVWLYVYWDISEHDMDVLRSPYGGRLFLNIIILGDDAKPVMGDSFEIPLTLDVREQYVLLPAGKKAMRVELVMESSHEKHEILAASSIVRLPQRNIDFSEFVTKKNIPPMLALSGFHEIVRDQFLRHRSFL